MSGPASPIRSRRPRRRPFGVLVICGLLIFQAVALGLAIVALAAVAVGSDTGEITVRFFGIDLTLAGDEARLQLFAIAALGTLGAITVIQMVLLLALKRIGWVITMLLVGMSLFEQLFAIWQGQATNALALFLDAITALYLNQSEVRRAFGVSAGRIDAALGRSADAVVGATLGDPGPGDAA
jgi:hypothetical protein